MTRRLPVPKRTILYPAMSLVLLAGLWTEAHLRRSPTVAAAYLQRTGRAMDGFAMEMAGINGTWRGADLKPPVPAAAVLYSSNILCRSYRQPSGWFDDDEHAVDLLILQCADVRDLEAYDPINCYSAQGFTLVHFRQRIWNVKNLMIHGMEYRFGLRNDPLGDELAVYNFYLVPHVAGRPRRYQDLDGTTVARLSDVYRSGADYRQRCYGAVQVQISADGQASRPQLDQALDELLEPNLKVIEELMNQ